jgi:hypothetical protein
MNWSDQIDRKLKITKTRSFKTWSFTVNSSISVIARFNQDSIDKPTKCALDNTNPTKADRARYIERANDTHFDVISYILKQI